MIDAEIATTQHSNLITICPALVVDATDEDAFIMSLAKNIARRSYRPLEILADIEVLPKRGYSAKIIIQKTGLSPKYVKDIVFLGDTTTPPQAQAMARALRDVQEFEGALKTCVTVPLTQHEYDAYVSFAYNVGPRAFCQSTLVKKLNAQDYPGACQELLRWRFFQGKDCALPTNGRLCGGLVTRREAEYRQCMGEAAP